MKFVVSLLRTGVGSARELAPVVGVVAFFQIVVLRQPFPNLAEMLFGLVLILVGLTLFVRGLEMGLFPLVVRKIGQKIAGFQIALKGVLINILNPKLTLFFFAFLPLFVSPDAVSPAHQLLGLSAVFMLMTLVIFALYGILASGVSRYLINSPKAIRWIQRTFAVIIAGLAAKLVLSEQ